MTHPQLRLRGVGKCFTLHHQGGMQLPVLQGVDFEVHPGECVVLDGPSGMGKSTLLKLVHANYRPSAGRIEVRTGEGADEGADEGAMLDVGRATPRQLLHLRRERIGYVSQFLRAIPRVPALDVVADALLEDAGDDAALQQAARERARQWLARLRIPERLWSLPPATFSGGEQQRINIACNMIKPRPLLLLDEPTASLDAANSATVIELIRDALARGAAVLGIFHDAHVGAAVATRRLDVAAFRGRA